MRSRASAGKKAFASHLRRNQTRPEIELGKAMSSAFPNVRIYRQSLCYGYILDFYVAADRPGSPYKGLAIEVDGPVHATQMLKDKLRDTALLKRGIRTVRFPTSMLESAMPAVLMIIGKEISLIKTMSGG